MKKSILIIALTLISIASFGQIKQPTSVRTQKQGQPYLDSLKKIQDEAKTYDAKHLSTAKKLEFKPDYQSPHTVTITVADASLLIMTPEQWNEVELSEQLTGKQIQQQKMAASIARQKLAMQINAYLKTEQDKFSADTAAANKKSLKK